MITDYTLVDGEPYEVARNTAQFLALGWQPYGPPMMIRYRGEDSGPDHMAQAMVKYEEVGPERAAAVETLRHFVSAYATPTSNAERDALRAIEVLK